MSMYVASGVLETCCVLVPTSIVMSAARELTKQEGIMFRHCLRMILLCGEFSQLEPPGLDPAE